ncbi:uncharacterized protein LOC129739886 [Uranotaenia lowii]|uniref:uncharacterized protein LOC129739886 n=1 Tax=Uranotaenia lowii TaxID=190385 RepID=UPI0024798D47|nr:uncharacterized protein LOC129739886 [Uranotaenia lowii]
MPIGSMTSYVFFASYFLAHHVDTIEFMTECVAAIFTIGELAVAIINIHLDRQSWLDIVEEMRNSATPYIKHELTHLFDNYFHRSIFFVKVYYFLVASTGIMYSTTAFILPDPRKYGLPLPAVLPFLASDSGLFYTVNTIYQNFVLLSSVHAAVFQFVINLFGILVACCQIDAIKLILKKFNGLIADPTTSEEILTEELMEIIRLHGLVKTYMSHFQDKFGWMFFVSFFSIGSIVAMSMNAVSNNLFSSITILMISTASTSLMYCAIGTYLIVANESLTRAIYELDWYILSTSNQKLFSFMLANSQESAALHAYFFPIDLSTFVQIMKASFSYFSILNQRSAAE